MLLRLNGKDIGLLVQKVAPEGDMLGKDVYAKIAELGIKSRTVETAKKELGIVTFRKGNAWYWKLPRTY